MSSPEANRVRELRAGFLAMLPLWLGIIPFALAFALLARTNGFSRFETVLMSLAVFAGSAQLAIAGMAADNAGALAILLTVLLLNLRHLLYGMTLDFKLTRPRSIPKPILAAGMTDEGMGITIAETRRRPATDWFFMGTVISLYLIFGTVTLVGALLGNRIPDPDRLHLDVVFPLVFLALLLPLLRNRRAIAIALTAAVLSVGLEPLTGSSNAILLAILGGAGAGALLPAKTDRSQFPSEDLPR